MSGSPFMDRHLYEHPASHPNGCPPLLFVHGVLHAARCWSHRFIPYLQNQGFHCFSLDLPGHGEDQAQFTHQIGLRDYLQAVRQAVETIPQPPVLVGHSMGGYLIQRFLEKHTLPGVILIAPLPPEGFRKPTWRLFRHAPGAFFDALLHLEMARAFRTPAQVRWAMYRDDLAESDLLERMDEIGREPFKAYVDMLLQHARRPKQTTPALILAPEADRLISVADCRRTADWLSGEMVILPQAAHNVLLDQDWQPAANILVHWLTQRKFPAHATSQPS